MGEPGGLPSMGSQSRTRLKRLSSSSSSRKKPEEEACGWTYEERHYEQGLLILMVMP